MDAKASNPSMKSILTSPWKLNPSKKLCETFDKNKIIFIHSNREIISFNNAKNVKDESTNKLTTSKLIAYNGIMPTKIYDKIKVTRISMAFRSATLTLKSLIK